jgi:hypothetical protein
MKIARRVAAVASLSVALLGLAPALLPSLITCTVEWHWFSGPTISCSYPDTIVS